MNDLTATIQARTFVKTLLEGAFPEKLSGPRHTGPEDEYIVIDTNGFAVDISPLFSDLVRDGWLPKKDIVTGTLVGASLDDLEIGMDVGSGTLEIGFPHVACLFDHTQTRARTLKFIDERLARYGFCRLHDYAIQPKTHPGENLWAKKGRGKIFQLLFHSAVHMNTLTASSQVHIDVTRNEVLPVLEMFLAISPVVIALNANSPVWNGQLDPDGLLAKRQHAWYGFTVEHGYWGNVFCGLNENRIEQAPTSFEELAQFLCCAPFIVRVEGSSIEIPGTSFEEWWEHNNEKLSDTQKREAYLNHEGTVWWQARARVSYGTIEVRPSCQNKHAVAGDALVLGLVENLDQTLDFVRSTRTHQQWRALEKIALTEGLHSIELCSAAHRLLALAKEGLLKRNFGEETLLLPLITRVNDKTSPAHVKLKIFKEGGIDALITHLLTNP